MLQRFLDPATLASISGLDLVAKTVVDGFVAGLHRSPAQLLTYLKLSGKRLGLLINFNEPVLKKGLRRVANHAPDAATAVPSAPSAPSAFFDFAFLNSLRLSVSAVNK